MKTSLSFLTLSFSWPVNNFLYFSLQLILMLLGTYHSFLQTATTPILLVIFKVQKSANPNAKKWSKKETPPLCVKPVKSNEIIQFVCAQCVKIIFMYFQRISGVRGVYKENLLVFHESLVFTCFPSIIV